MQCCKDLDVCMYIIALRHSLEFCSSAIVVCIKYSEHDQFHILHTYDKNNK